MIIFKTFQSASFMKTEYKGFEITVTFERDLSGKDEVHYSINLTGDRVHLSFGRMDWNGELPEFFIEKLKARIDHELDCSY